MESTQIEKPEEMAEFFNIRAGGYDNHMKKSVAHFEKLYSLISEPVEKTQDNINILDLGCGTGLEIKSLLEKVPNANITGLDMSEEMLKGLKKKYKNHLNQINLVKESYITYDLGQQNFNYVVSVMTMHHLLQENKLKLYRKIHNCLRKGGKYIEGDYIVSPSEEAECLLEYKKQIELMDNKNNGLYHIDIPFCIDTQLRLFKEAGFKNIDVLWKEGSAAIIVAET